MALRAGEPWFATAYRAYEAVWAGEKPPTTTGAAIAPFLYGRWDGAARAHAATDAEQSNYGAADRHADPGAFDPAEALDALAGWDARVLVLAGGLDGGPLPRVAATIAGLLSHAEPVVQPGAGHFPWLDDPRCFTGDRRDLSSGMTVRTGPYGAVTVSPPRRGEAKASRSSRVSPVSRATSAVSRAPQSMPRSR